MNWAAFHFWAAFATVAYTLIDARPKVGRQHTLGAEILMLTWIASWAARNLVETTAPYLAYAVIDIVAVIVFASIMRRHRAIWAALCVVFHALMLVSHLAFYLTGRIEQGTYLWSLGSLFSASVLTVLIATAAGRHEWGVRLDDYFSSLVRGWSWSGLIRSRLPDDSTTVA